MRIIHSTEKKHTTLLVWKLSEDVISALRIQPQLYVYKMGVYHILLVYHRRRANNNNINVLTLGFWPIFSVFTNIIIIYYYDDEAPVPAIGSAAWQIRNATGERRPPMRSIRRGTRRERKDGKDIIIIIIILCT